MKEIFKKTTNSMIISAILALVVGVVMIVFPNLSIKTLSIVASIYIILHGIVLIVLDFKASKYYLPLDLMLPGILSVILGIILISKPDILSTIFTIAIGVWIILSSINSLKMAITLRDEDTPWLLLLLFGLIDLIIGLIVVFNPFAIKISLTVFIGIMIIIHSVIDIVDILIIKRDAKKISKALEKSFKSF